MEISWRQFVARPIISKIILFWYASVSWQEFSICFPIAACKQAPVSPYRCVAWTRKSPNLPQPLLHASVWSRWAACLGFNKSLYQKVGCVCKGGGSTCKSFANMKSSKYNPECVLLEGFHPFLLWIGKYAVWQNAPLPAKAAILPTGLGWVIKFYTFDCHLGGNESTIYSHHEKNPLSLNNTNSTSKVSTEEMLYDKDF